MAFPDFATVGSGDNFDRANENPLSGGGRWANFAGAGLSGPMAVVSNQMVASVAGYCGSMWNAQFTRAEIFVTVVNDNDDAKYIKLALSGPDGGLPRDPPQNGYMVTVDENNADEWLICRIDNQVVTVLGAPATSAVFSGDGIGLSHNPLTGDISAYKSDAGAPYTLIGSRTDTTYKRGYPGIVAHNTTLTFDNVGIGGVGWVQPISDTPPFIGGHGAC